MATIRIHGGEIGKIGGEDTINPDLMKDHYPLSMPGDIPDVYYDGGSYRAAVQSVRDARASIENLPQPQRDKALEAFDIGIRGINEASRLIQGPLINQRILELIRGGLSDYHTNMKNLEGLDIFPESRD